MHVVGESFNEVYNQLAQMLRDDAQYTASPRGMKIKETLGVSFRITNPRHRGIFNPARKFKNSYVVAEALWYLSGNDRTDWISYYAPFWKDISDDGVTANSAYGARIFEPHDIVAGGRFIQWQWVINELKRDPDSRRAIIHIKTASDSLDAKKDVPCTLALQFMIREGKLHLVVNMRSSDLILGIANDIPAFTLFQEVMAYELGVELGEYIHVSNSLHVYERHWNKLDKMCLPENVGVSQMMAKRIGANPPIPSAPPIPILLDHESNIRDTHNLGELKAYVEGLDDAPSRS